jgi:hypothetical protein
VAFNVLGYLEGFVDLLLPCPLSLIARTGHASTQISHVLPMHFSLLNMTEESSPIVIAFTGHRDKQAPQLKHFSAATSISSGMVTVTPFSRKALTSFSEHSEGKSARIVPPCEST